MRAVRGQRTTAHEEQLSKLVVFDVAMRPTTPEASRVLEETAWLMELQTGTRIYVVEP